MSSWIGKLECGLNCLDFFGPIKVTRTQNTFTIVLQRDSEKKKIMRIKNEQHVWKYHSDEISLVLTKYYEYLFSSARSDPSNGVLDHVPQIITEEMNASLTCDFMECEVQAALQQMAPLKAPSPNEMPLIFFPILLEHC